MRFTISGLAATLLAIATTADTLEATQLRRTTTDDQVRLIVSWYQRYLGREPDVAGLQGWAEELRRGGNVEANILGSDEYFIRHGSTPESFIVGLYVDVLQRQPALEEVQGWLSRWQQIGYNRTAVATEFLRAAQTEFATRGYPQYVPPTYVPMYPQPPTFFPFSPPPHGRYRYIR